MPPDDNITYVLWYNRHDSFRRAVLKRVLELVDHFVQPADEKKRFISGRDSGANHEPAATEPVPIKSLRFKWELKKPPQQEEKVYVSKEYGGKLGDELREAFKKAGAFIEQEPGTSAVPVICLFSDQKQHCPFFDQKQQQPELIEQKQEPELIGLLRTTFIFEQKEGSDQPEQGRQARRSWSLSHDTRAVTKSAISMGMGQRSDWKPDAILLHCGESFSFFQDGAEKSGFFSGDGKATVRRLDGPEPGDFDYPIWEIWPNCTMLQRVAAEDALQNIAKRRKKTAAGKAAASAVKKNVAVAPDDSVLPY